MDEEACIERTHQPSAQLNYVRSRWVLSVEAGTSIKGKRCDYHLWHKWENSTNGHEKNWQMSKLVLTEKSLSKIEA